MRLLPENKVSFGSILLSKFWQFSSKSVIVNPATFFMNERYRYNLGVERNFMEPWVATHSGQSWPHEGNKSRPPTRTVTSSNGDVSTVAELGHAISAPSERPQPAHVRGWAANHGDRVKPKTEGGGEIGSILVREMERERLGPNRERETWGRLEGRGADRPEFAGVHGMEAEREIENEREEMRDEENYRGHLTSINWGLFFSEGKIPVLYLFNWGKCPFDP